MSRRTTSQKAVLYSVCFGRPLACSSPEKTSPAVVSTSSGHRSEVSGIRRPLFKSPLSHADTRYIASAIRQLSNTYTDQTKDSIERFQEEWTQVLHDESAKVVHTVDSRVSHSTNRLKDLKATVTAFRAQHRAVLHENISLKRKLSQSENTVTEQSLQIDSLKAAVTELTAKFAERQELQSRRRAAKQTQQRALVQATADAIFASWADSSKFLESVLGQQQLKLANLSSAVHSLQLSTEMYEEVPDCSDNKELFELYSHMQERYSSHFGTLLTGQSLHENIKILVDSYHNQVLANSSETTPLFVPGQISTRTFNEDSLEGEDIGEEPAAVSQATHAWLLEEYELTCKALEAKEREVEELLRRVQELAKTQDS